MIRGEQFARLDEQSLIPIVELSDHLALVKNQVIGVDLLSVPLDQYGIPRRDAFVTMALGSIATEYIWRGFEDAHHIAWPRANYQIGGKGQHQSKASQFRECESMKVRVPRQLHNYFHKVTLPPPVPSEEVLRQYLTEQIQVKALYQVATLPFEQHHDSDEQTKDEWRKKRYLAKLEVMKSGEVGHMPDLELLATMDFNEARALLRDKACIKRFPQINQALDSATEDAA